MDYLPNEIRLNIFRNFDLPTALQFLRLGSKIDSDLIHNCLKFDVSIKVKHVKKGFMVIELFDLKEKIVAMTWQITEIHANKVKIRQIDSTGKSLYHINIKKNRFSNAVFRIVGRIFSKPMFRVKKLLLVLSKFRGNVNFGRLIHDLDELHLFDCNQTMQTKIKNNLATPPRRVFSDMSRGYARIVPPSEFTMFMYFGTPEIYLGLHDIFKAHNFFENGLEELKKRDGSLNNNGIEKLINTILLPRPNNNSASFGYFLISSTAPGSFGTSSGFTGDMNPNSHDSLENGVRLITFPNSEYIFGAVEFQSIG